MTMCHNGSGCLQGNSFCLMGLLHRWAHGMWDLHNVKPVCSSAQVVWGWWSPTPSEEQLAIESCWAMQPVRGCPFSRASPVDGTIPSCLQAASTELTGLQNSTRRCQGVSGSGINKRGGSWGAFNQIISNQNTL